MSAAHVPGSAPGIVNAEQRQAAIRHMRDAGLSLPTFGQLADPSTIPAARTVALADVDRNAPDGANLWRIHWNNAADGRGTVPVPDHIVLPSALTGVAAPIVVLLGARFPLIGAHKVLPAYAGLVTQLVTGAFDLSHHKAVWPSTGNYCRGGIAVSRIIGCAGVAVLPAGMSQERFDWLEKWVSSPAHIVRTPGTESNVKEIYDACNEMQKDESNVILNQFSAYSNYMVHRAATGAACASVFESLKAGAPGSRLAAFVSATGSAGTIAAGDHLKAIYGTRIAAVEALECPTMLENGYGEHNIQGIGDKHIPLIHNVMNTDFVVAVSDRASDRLNLLFGTDVGRAYLADRKKIDPALIAAFDNIGISGMANIVASIKLAKYMRYGADDVVVTIATDGAGLYETERSSYLAKHYGGSFDTVDAAETYTFAIEAASTADMLELSESDRRRIFNLGYYTWVEQQGIAFEDFERRKHQSFWDGLAAQLPVYDRLIEEFNAEVNAS
ncbi:pyridoxal-phosphate dependent enzyme [Roseixanthobacter pseudopolyaromaticivorans]|uniref:pyridoxal-phosphate dependent enzyme n=1 Tax=Xanthobacteraceae TaxID=335928 RepID=UPI00372B722B